jgi:transposase
MAQVYLYSNWIPVLRHPPQSPDLNPMEACWNILKQRARKRVFHSLEEYKQVMQDEWSKITIEEVRARIAEMPDRCKRPVESRGAPIKSDP